MRTNNKLATNGTIPKKHQFIAFTLALVFILALGTVPAFADNDDKRHDGYSGYSGGYSGPGPALVTVEQAKGMSDDAMVALKGNITQHLGGKKYEFKDATGTITVEISGKRWQGQNIGPDDLVEIHGEIDKEWTSIKIEAKRIIKH